ncbi:MAG: excinuclease ABC subunit UvrA [Sandaracinaceae bacterium]|nr:excinuclease ABC subunit UvrA [Sandaracinaceae bacterium]
MKILVRGARVHNLQGIDVDIPHRALTVVTGPSGSGKSSLVYDTIFAESQRRFIEAIGPAAQRWLEVLVRPEVDRIEGLLPAIAVAQEAPRVQSRSTVGTLSELHDLLRMLFARFGEPHCPACATPLVLRSPERLATELLEGPPQRLLVTAPLFPRPHPDPLMALAHARKSGFVRVLVDHVPRPLEGEWASLLESTPSRIDAIVDRLEASPKARSRLLEAIESAFRTSEGIVRIVQEAGPELLFVERPICPSCGFAFPSLSPRSFSWNLPEGACPACGGLGFCEAQANSKKQKRRKSQADPEESEEEERPLQTLPCAECRGLRLRKEALSVHWSGRSLAEILTMPLSALAEFFASSRQRLFAPSPKEREILCHWLNEIEERLSKLLALGLGHLELNRSSAQLSEGERRRIQIAARIGANVSGVLYVFDEVSAGLHPGEIAEILPLLFRLRDAGNTLLLVDHDLNVITQADHVIELGPGAGRKGGRVLFEGPPALLATAQGSRTGPWLSGQRLSPRSPHPPRGILHFGPLRFRYFSDFSISLPLGQLLLISGPSGSGKSSLLEALSASLEALLRGQKPPFPLHKEGHLERIVVIDDRPIGRTPRATIATALGIMAPLRELFASLPEAKARGYDASRFGTHLPGGRCEHCAGLGFVRIELAPLPEATIPCEICQGTRYARETLEVRYRGHSIADLLAMPAEDAIELLSGIPPIATRLEALRWLGLGYLPLGQATSTLSGGERQRLRLAREFSRSATGSTLYLLDEASRGLHMEDLALLADGLDRLVREGNSVIVVDASLRLAPIADCIFELGPGAGPNGSRLLAQGPPHALASLPTPTGHAIAKALHPPAPPPHSGAFGPPEAAPTKSKKLPPSR